MNQAQTWLLKEEETNQNSTAFWLGMGWIAIVGIMQAHLIEDAFIPLRVVEQFWAGNGLVWNMGERVQVSTSLLWQILILPSHWIKDSPTGLLLTCWLLTMGFFRILLNPKTPWPNTLLVTAMWTSCLSFQEFMLCGLEGPLVAILAAGTVRAQLKGNATQIGLWSGLLAISRPDCILIALPFWIANLKWFPERQWRAILLAGLPLLAQTVFATIYFANPFPNTFLAKMMGEIEGTGENGLLYLIESFTRDPAAGLVTVFGLGIAGWTGNTRITKICVAATLLYWAFILVSADYMLGRFLLPPLALAITLSALLHIKPQVAILLTSLLALTLLKAEHKHEDWSRVSTEKLKVCSIHQYDIISGKFENKESWATHNKIRNEWSILATIGIVGYMAPPSHHIIDPLGLADPVLSKLPGIHQDIPHPGHVGRSIPDRYLEAHQRNNAGLIPNLEVRKLVEIQNDINNLPLLSKKRFQKILEYHLFTISDKTRFEQRFPNVARIQTGTIPGPQGVLIKTEKPGTLTGMFPEVCRITGLNKNMNIVWESKISNKTKMKTDQTAFIHIRPEQPGLGKDCTFQWTPQ